MASTTTESYAALQARSDELLQPLDVQERAVTSVDLMRVADLLVSEVQLRRTVTDVAIPPQQRREVVSGLLSTRISATACELVADAVASRWSHAADLVTAIEELAVWTQLRASDAANTLDNVEDEVFRFERLVIATPELLAAVTNQGTSLVGRLSIVTDLLQGKADAASVQLLCWAVRGIGGRRFEASCEYLVSCAAQMRDASVAYVSAASELSREQLRHISARLSQMYGRKIHVHVDIDPSLLGGVTIHVGNDLYDGSVARKLAQARSELTV